MTARKTKREKRIQDNWFLAVMIIILAAAILWLLLGAFLRKPQVTTIEKIHILDLAYCYSCDGNVPETGEETKNEEAPHNKEEGNTEPSEDDPDIGNFEVFDKDITWRTFSNISLFQDSKYNFREKIAPGSTNIYEFTVRNRTGISLDYNMEFEECNSYNINMKYRLMHEGKYIAGSEEEWVTFDKLNQYTKLIQNSTEDKYSLEWKWLDSENDTEIGENADSNYGLRVQVKAIQHLNN